MKKRKKIEKLIFRLIMMILSLGHQNISKKFKNFPKLSIIFPKLSIIFPNFSNVFPKKSKESKNFLTKSVKSA